MCRRLFKTIFTMHITFLKLIYQDALHDNVQNFLEGMVSKYYKIIFDIILL